ncbi:hypothetical protein NA57DRAFT_77335 [Rhizodiscina lignyota]|uniref:Uncharacterized protein n=1 Tax=Rhizodiscina lignyota TaxID=1504668 RepID=A0A9P4IF54_9PEZI|nr:hypothetical protein NA57DRAFT_77335 [Rhizodiscina lignyota]
MRISRLLSWLVVFFVAVVVSWTALSLSVGVQADSHGDRDKDGRPANGLGLDVNTKFPRQAHHTESNTSSVSEDSTSLSKRDQYSQERKGLSTQGKELICLMQERLDGNGNLYANLKGRETNTQSQWDSFQQLEADGWVRQTNNLFVNVDMFSGMLQSLEQSTSNDQYTPVLWKHKGTQTSDGKWTGTQAQYLNYFNTEEGIIIMILAYGPAYMMTHREPIAPNPQLPEHIKQWSDVTWIEWQHQCNNNAGCIRKIKYFVIWHVNNIAFQHMAQYRYNWPDDQIPEWSSERNQKMIISKHIHWAAPFIATPVGRAPAWFLISHKRDLGVKQITAVQVFRDQNQRTNTETGAMLMYVGAVTSPQRSKEPGCCVIL